MSQKNFLTALRAVAAVEETNGPQQHRLRTPECPPLTRFATGASWSEEERRHQASCAYCLKMLGLVAQIEAEERGPALVPLPHAEEQEARQ
jgi:hypothetical protein